MEEVNFNSLSELYIRIYPALSAKTHELHLLGFKSLNEDQIWRFLTTNKWPNTLDLTLNQIINDIFNLDIEAMINDLNLMKAGATNE
ncbi:MAG TPA: post-transcriptional regulator [Bacilli bacterium]|nr:post-transcriptional regulator [Bacilli bacterium]